MRVSILTHGVQHGAFATIAMNIATGLAEHGVDVDVCYLQGPDPAALSSVPAGLQLVRVGGRSRTCWLPLARHLRARRPDALISLGWVLNPAAVVAVAVARTRTPLYLNEQSSLSYKSGVEHRSELRLRVLGPLARWLYPRATGVTGASRPVVDDLTKHIGLRPQRPPLHVVPNPIDATTVRRRAQLPDEHIETSESGPLFVNVARHVRQKNLPLLLRAFALYRESGGTGKLVLVGHGPDTPALTRLVHELGLDGHVVLRGLLVNPFPQLAAASAFVLSSEEEGFGLVLVEAMALGVPVISTACPGGPAEILRNGEAGLLVPNGDVDALAAALHRIAAEPGLRDRLRAAGTERAADFGPAAVAARWLAVFGHTATHPAGIGGGHR